MADMVKNKKSEADFCEETSKLIAGLFVGTKRENVIFVPEVPVGYYSNNQIDMLLLDVKNLEYLFIEFKLKDYNALLHQLERAENKGIPVVGIINSRPQKITADRDIYEYLPESRKAFSYTGRDVELELLGDPEKGLLYKCRWHSIYYGSGTVYYWAYKNESNNFRGGITSGGRDGFATVYMRAIKNLHAHYGKLDFMLTHTALNSGYTVATAKKYYRQVANS